MTWSSVKAGQVPPMGRTGRAQRLPRRRASEAVVTRQGIKGKPGDAGTWRNPGSMNSSTLSPHPGGGVAEQCKATGVKPWIVVDEAQPEYPSRYGTSSGGNPRGAERLGKCGDNGVTLCSSLDLIGEPTVVAFGWHRRGNHSRGRFGK